MSYYILDRTTNLPDIHFNEFLLQWKLEITKITFSFFFLVKNAVRYNPAQYQGSINKTL